jgi:quinol monooxygenase YgiN
VESDASEILSAGLSQNEGCFEMSEPKEGEAVIVVIATILTEAGQRAEVLKHFQDVVPEVRNEVGCIEYGPVVDVETMIPAQSDPDPNKIVMVEKWESIEDLEQHLIAPHMIDFRSKVKDLICSVDLQVLSPVTE